VCVDVRVVCVWVCVDMCVGVCGWVFILSVCGCGGETASVV